MLKKIGEEATETVMAAKDGEPGRIVAETADLWFHCLVMLARLRAAARAGDRGTRATRGAVGTRREGRPKAAASDGDARQPPAPTETTRIRLALPPPGPPLARPRNDVHDHRSDRRWPAQMTDPDNPARMTPVQMKPVQMKPVQLKPVQMTSDRSLP